ncbi:hypothetical protein AV654_19865, partial [Paenibacillus elgii]
GEHAAGDAEEHAAGDAGEHAGDDAGEDAAGDAGEHAAGDVGEPAADDAGEHAGDDAGEDAAGDAGEHAAGAAGEHAAGDAGEHAAGDAEPHELVRRGVVKAPLHLIDPNPFNPRKNFDEATLTELMNSIQEVGLLQMPVARVVNNRYQLVAGERRYRAIKALGRTEIPLNVVEMTNLQAATAALTENMQRDDVTPIGVAREIDRMMKEFQMKQGDIAQKLGVTQAKVSQYLSLLRLAEPLLEMLERGELSQSIARTIVGMDEETQVQYIGSKDLDKLTVKEVQEFVNFYKEIEKRMSADISEEEHVSAKFAKYMYQQGTVSMFDTMQVNDFKWRVIKLNPEYGYTFDFGDYLPDGEKYDIFFEAITSFEGANTYLEVVPKEDIQWLTMVVDEFIKLHYPIDETIEEEDEEEEEEERTEQTALPESPSAPVNLVTFQPKPNRQEEQHTQEQGETVNRPESTESRGILDNSLSHDEAVRHESGLQEQPSGSDGGGAESDSKEEGTEITPEPLKEEAKVGSPIPVLNHNKERNKTDRLLQIIQEHFRESHPHTQRCYECKLFNPDGTTYTERCKASVNINSFSRYTVDGMDMFTCHSYKPTIEKVESAKCEGMDHELTMFRLLLNQCGSHFSPVVRRVEEFDQKTTREIMELYREADAKTKAYYVSALSEVIAEQQYDRIKEKMYITPAGEEVFIKRGVIVGSEDI